MSAPPPFNPLESRGARGPGRGFRRGRRGPPSSGPGSHDEVIQGTDTDAAVSRLSAVELGYLDDPYAVYFVQSSQGPGSRRLPIINRGTYSRTTALDTIIRAFLFAPGGAEQAPPFERQIISLGAGTDTRPFRLFAGSGREGLIYHEVDFPTACTKKLRTVQAVPVLRNILADAKDTSNGNWSARPSSGGEYYCHGLDLRNLAKEDAPQSIPGLRTDVPTLLVSECCLCYLAAPEARQIIKWFTDRIADTAVVVYEPIRPDDAFGRMMVSNLAARHIRMPTLEAYKEPADQVDRLEEAGFATAKVLTIHDVYERWVSAEEKARLDRLEGLDEVEEWILLASHYVVAWAWRGSGFWMCDERANHTPAGS